MRILLLALILFACPVQAGSLASMLGGSPPVALTETLLVQQTDASLVTSFAQYTTQRYGGTVFTDTADRLLSKVEFFFALGSGSISGKTFYCKIYTLNGTALNTLIATSTGIAGQNSWISSGGWGSFVFASPYVSLTANTSYAVVVDSGGVDGANVVGIGYKGTEGNSYCSKMKVWLANGAQDLSYNEDTAIKIYVMQ